MHNLRKYMLLPYNRSLHHNLLLVSSSLILHNTSLSHMLCIQTNFSVLSRCCNYHSDKVVDCAYQWGNSDPERKQQSSDKKRRLVTFHENKLEKSHVFITFLRLHRNDYHKKTDGECDTLYLRAVT